LEESRFGRLHLAASHYGDYDRRGREIQARMTFLRPPRKNSRFFPIHNRAADH